MSRFFSASARLLVFLPVLLLAPAAMALEPSEHGGELRWPRTQKSEGHTFVVHQPQLEEWKHNQLKARAAVVLTLPKGDTLLGAIWMSARTEVDKKTRTVSLYGIGIDRAVFPAALGATPHYQVLLQQAFAGFAAAGLVVELDHLEAELSIDQLHRSAKATAFSTDPPKIIVSKVPAVLVPLSGAPVYQAVAGTSFERVINTRALLLRDGDGRHYLHVYDGWMAAPGFDGPWEAVAVPSSGLVRAEKLAKEQGPVDLMTGAASVPKGASPPTLAKQAPAVHVETVPAALIVFDGEPSYQALAQTELMYVANTRSDVFVYIPKSRHYVLLAGRWFAAPSLDGPFTYVAADALPGDFANIPDDSPKENVKAAVAGTAQARDALIASAIPQNSTVEIATAKLPSPRFDGEPKIVPIEGTKLHTVVNTPTPMIQVPEGEWYAVENAVWFKAASPEGPFTVATSVPEAIYTIPPTSPLFYVTFSYVYGSGDGVVYVGYLPGYLGTYATPTNVVYGTGYHYDAWAGNLWVPAPATYSDGATVAYTNSGTWTVVYTTAYYPFWGPWYYYDGKNYWNDKHTYDPSWGAIGDNIRDRWDDRHDGDGQPQPRNEERAQARTERRNSRTGESLDGANANAQAKAGDWAHQADRETPMRSGDDLYTDRDGNVFRRNTDGQWQKHGATGWGDGNARRGDLDGSYRSRSTGNARAGTYRSGGGFGGGRGGFGGGRGGGGGRGRR